MQQRSIAMAPASHRPRIYTAVCFFYTPVAFFLQVCKYFGGQPEKTKHAFKRINRRLDCSRRGFGKLIKYVVEKSFLRRYHEMCFSWRPSHLVQDDRRQKNEHFGRFSQICVYPAYFQSMMGTSKTHDVATARGYPCNFLWCTPGKKKRSRKKNRRVTPGAPPPQKNRRVTRRKKRRAPVLFSPTVHSLNVTLESRLICLHISRANSSRVWYHTTQLMRNESF